MKLQVGDTKLDAGQNNVWHCEKADPTTGEVHVARFLGNRAEELADQWLRLKFPKTE